MQLILRKIVVTILKALLKVYKSCVSPFLGTQCRFHPSCSVYCVSAVEKHGVFYGFWLGLKRIVRCNPWYTGKDHALE